MDTETLTDLADTIVPNSATSTEVKIVLTLIAFVGGWLIHRFATRYVLRRVHDPKSEYWARKGVTYTTFALVALVVWEIWIASVTSIATFLGLLAAGLAIALRVPVENIAGWLFIVSRRPFQVGDRIQIDEHIGDVADVRVFQISLIEIGSWVDADQPTGRIIHIPNGWVFSKSQTNYVFGFEFIWDEIPVLITFESDWIKAKQLLMRIVKRHSEEFAVRTGDSLSTEVGREFLMRDFELAGNVFTSVEDSGVLLTMRYTCHPEERRQVAQAIWEDILIEFAEHPDIDLAYPTTRFYTINEDQQAPEHARTRDEAIESQPD